MLHYFSFYWFSYLFASVKEVEEADLGLPVQEDPAEVTLAQVQGLQPDLQNGGKNMSFLDSLEL